MPMLFAKKEVFTWIKEGKKTIDIRKGKHKPGRIIFFLSGPNRLMIPITKMETGKINSLVTEENYKQVIPSALRLQDAYNYLQRFYGEYDGIFTAYYLGSIC
jgi:hypothetical protein